MKLVEASESLSQKIQELGPWFHNIHLPDGTQTAPDHFLGDFPGCKWVEISSCLPQDLSGMSVLDIGCNAGFYSIELAKKGANVIGIDVDAHYLKQAKWVARQWQLRPRVTFRQMQVYDLIRMEEKFDLVLFMGVFYHLRYPTLALDIVARKVKRWLLFQTLTMPGVEIKETPLNLDLMDRDAMLDLGWPKMAFIEHRMAGDPAMWWAPNHTAVEAMLRSCGMKVIQRPAHEFYLCEPDSSNPSFVETWNAMELLSATGQEWKM